MHFESCDCISELGPEREWGHPQCQMQPAAHPQEGHISLGNFFDFTAVL